MGESPVRPSSLSPATRCQASIYESSSLPPVMFSSCLPPVPAKLVQRIQDGLLIEMGELSSDRLDSPDHFTNEQSTNNHSKVPKVTSIMEWVQCLYRSSQPDCTPDLIGYQNLIMWTSMLGQEGHWILYDRCFRCLPAPALVNNRYHSVAHGLSWVIPKECSHIPKGSLQTPSKNHNHQSSHMFRLEWHSWCSMSSPWLQIWSHLLPLHS